MIGNPAPRSHLCLFIASDWLFSFLYPLIPLRLLSVLHTLSGEAVVTSPPMKKKLRLTVSTVFFTSVLLLVSAGCDDISQTQRFSALRTFYEFLRRLQLCIGGIFHLKGN